MTAGRRTSAAYLAHMAHELRTPLHAIRSWAHVLEKSLTDADPTVRRAIAGILAGVEQQARLIDGLVQMEDPASDKPRDRGER